MEREGNREEGDGRTQATAGRVVAKGIVLGSPVCVFRCVDVGGKGVSCVLCWVIERVHFLAFASWSRIWEDVVECETEGAFGHGPCSCVRVIQRQRFFTLYTLRTRTDTDTSMPPPTALHRCQACWILLVLFVLLQSTR